MMQKAGNKGEWSELYVLLKLMADGKLYTADGELNKQENVFYEIVNIMREEAVGKLTFSFADREGKVSIKLNNNVEKNIEAEAFHRTATLLFDSIKQANAASFEVPVATRFMKEILCEKIKAPSLNKSDILITIHDSNANVTLSQGFSIKSQLGKPATLLNAGRNTNFVYKIVGKFTDKNMQEVNALLTDTGDISVKDRLKYLKEHDCGIKFDHMVSATFCNNLMLIDGSLPTIIAELMTEYYMRGIVNIKAALGYVKERNPLKFDLSEKHPYYEYKLKKFLVDTALGMLPGRAWSGYTEATGGYIIVKEDGDVLCYHLYHRNEFEDYLLNQVRFDRGGAQRHDYAKVEKVEDSYYIKLNLQIRFLK